MKSPLIVSLLALFVSAIALTMVLVSSPAPSARVEASRVEAAPGPMPVVAPVLSMNSDLVARLDELALENATLRDRVAALELRPVPESRVALANDADLREELETLREEVRASLGVSEAAGVLDLGTSPSPEFTERVAQSMSAIRVTEARENARKNVESRTTRMREKLPSASAQLGLDSYQEGALETALLGIYETQSQYGVMFATGEVAGRAELGPIFQGDMTAFQAELEGILTPDQLARYKTLGKQQDDNLFPFHQPDSSR